MKYANNQVSDLKIAYIGGGSRGWAWTFMTDLSMDDSLSGTIRLYDIDEAAAKNNEIIGNKLTNREDTTGKWNYVTATSLEEALTGCDFAVISILPGTFDEMDSDVHLPERLGIYQSVGDTAGPGGMIRALRTIPMFVTIAEAVKKYSPDAWVINYTNPMSLCVKTLYHVFPQIKAFGCCHEVFGTQKVLKGICEETFAAGDRHLAEFMPGSDYLKDPETVKSWKFGLTTVAWRKDDLKNRLAKSHRLAGGEEEIELKASGEEGILLIKALCGLEKTVSNVNIPNSFLQVPNLPAEAVVETNALFSRDSIKPVVAGSIPENVLELIEPHVANHQRILEAALTYDHSLVYEAFLNDPLVKDRAGEEEIKKLADDMIENTLAYLPEGWK